MIFSSDQIRHVLTGRKSQVRVPYKGEPACRYRIGRNYGIKPNPRAEEACRIVILATTLQTLADVTDQDARREGHQNLAGYHQHIRDGNDGKLDLTQQVWALQFDVHRDPVRLLHRDSTHGYTENPHNAMGDEPEAVDVQTQEQISKDAREQGKLRNLGADQALLQELTGLEQQLATLTRLAQQRGIDIRDDLHVAKRQRAALERRIEAIRCKVTRDAA